MTPSNSNLINELDRFENILRRIRISKNIHLPKESLESGKSELPLEMFVRIQLIDHAPVSTDPVLQYGHLWIDSIRRADRMLNSRDFENIQFPLESVFFFYSHGVFWQQENPTLYEAAKRAITELIKRLVNTAHSNPDQIELIVSFLYDGLINISGSLFISKNFIDIFVPIVCPSNPSSIQMALRVHLAAEFVNFRTDHRRLERSNSTVKQAWDALCDRETISNLSLQASEECKNQHHKKILQEALKRLYL